MLARREKRMIRLASLQVKGPETRHKLSVRKSRAERGEIPKTNASRTPCHRHRTLQTSVSTGDSKVGRRKVDRGRAPVAPDYQCAQWGE